MWAVEVDTLLLFDRLLDHQVLKKQGLLVEIDARERRSVVFVTHQWLGYHHPDPEMHQFRALQGAIRALKKGMVGGLGDWCSWHLLDLSTRFWFVVRSFLKVRSLLPPRESID